MFTETRLDATPRRSTSTRRLELDRLEERLLLDGPDDTTAPRIIDVEAVLDPRGKSVVAVRLVADESLATAPAQDIANYQIRQPGKDKRLGTADDRATPPTAAEYNPASRTITLRMAPLKVGAFFQISASGDPGAITDDAGNRLDGDFDTNAGGTYLATLALGLSLKYADTDGDSVALKLAGGDLLQFTQTSADVDPRLKIINRVAATSTLTGSIKKAPRGDGRESFAPFAGDSIVNRLPAAFIIDTPPDAPTALSLTPATDSGTSNSDEITNVTSPTIEGLAEAGSVVRLFRDGVQVAEANSTGAWQIPVGPLANGQHSFTATATDAAGNVSPVSTPLVVTIDTTAPAVPVFGLDPASDTDPDGDDVTEFDVVTLVGDTAASTRVQLLETGSSTESNGSGRFSFGGISLESGPNRFTVRASDVAGNSSDSSRTIWGLGAGDKLLSEGSQYVVHAVSNVELGQFAGTRRVSFDVFASFDATDMSAAIEDTFLVYLVDPSDPSRTLLDRGTAGTSLFLWAGDQVEYPRGLVSFDGTTVSIDVTRLGGLAEGQLKFQLVGSDGDAGTVVQVSNVRSVVDASGVSGQEFPQSTGVSAPGGAVDLSGFVAAPDVELVVGNVRVGSPYRAEIQLRNRGAALGRNIAVVFRDLPNGVTLQNASGLDGDGSPYINISSAIASGGLNANQSSRPVAVTFDNPGNVRFALRPAILVGGPNRAPQLDAIGPLRVMPGGRLSVPVVATDPDGDPVMLSIRRDASAPALPTGRLSADHRLIFRPTPSELGDYEFTLVATDGSAETTRTVSLSVEPDLVTTTRVSGTILDVDGTPLSGITVDIGAVQGLSGADGSFLLDLGSGPLVSDTIKIRGELFAGPAVYPFIAEKLPLLLEHEVYGGWNNVIDRPIFLPALDVANGEQIDPGEDEMVTTPALPGVSVFVAAGTLMNQQGAPFEGVLSITEVPIERTPAALPAHLRTDLVVTIQPGEMVFASPAPMTFPNRAGWAPGTLMDLWSINPVTGDFDDVGDMQVSADGTTIETISGGVRNSSWHLPAPPPPPVPIPPAVEPKNHNTAAMEQSYCSSATSECELHTGAVIESHDLVAYQSLGMARGLRLVYDSLRADPRPIVHFNIDHVALDPNLRLVADLTIRRGSFRSQVPGYGGGELGLRGGEHVWNMPSVIGLAEAALQADLRDQPSGQYDYTLNLGRYRFTGSTLMGSSTAETGTLVHVNTVQSQFGSGWGLAGLHQIVRNPNGSILLVDGDGSEMVFGVPLGAGEPFQSPAGDFSRLEEMLDGTFLRTVPNGTVHTFHAPSQGGALAQLRDRNGNTTRFDYDGAGRLVKITDPVGLETTLTIGTHGKVSSFRDPAGRETQFEYDAAGNLVRITDPDGSIRRFEYDAGHRMTAETDPRGHREELTYDFAGRLRQARRKDGSVLEYSPVQMRALLPPDSTIRPLDPPVARIRGGADAFSTDGNGNVRRLVLDQSGQYVTATDPIGPSDQVVWNALNLVGRRSDGRGNITAHRYDERGNLLSVRDSITGPPIYVFFSGDIIDQAIVTALGQLGLHATVGASPFDWDGTQADLTQFAAVLLPLPGSAQTMPPAGQQALVDYVNQGGGLITSSRSDAVFDILNSVIPVSDELPRSIGPSTTFTQVTFDPVVAQGLPQSFSFRTSQLFEFEDTQRARPGATVFYRSSSTNADGVVGWDQGTGRVISLSTEMAPGLLDDNNYVQLIGNAIEWASNGAGPSYQSFSYDRVFSQMTSRTDGAGRRTVMDVDPANGNTLSITQVVGDVGGGDDVVTTMTYTALGLVDLVTDPLGRITDHDYDALGRNVSITRAKGTADESVIRFEYDAAGNITATIDPLGNRTEFSYDARNRVVRITEPDPDGPGPLTSPVTRFTHDPAGNVITRTDQLGNVTQFEYDAMNRRTRTIHATGDVSLLRYDLHGNVVESVDELNHVTQFRYDARNRVIELIDPLGGVTRRVYDADGNTIEMIDPVGNQTTFLFDARSRQIRVTDPLGRSTQYEYDASDNETLKVDRRGRRIARGYDDLNRLVAEDWSGGSNNPIRYVYDAAGNLLVVDDFFSTLTFAYDNLNRVTSVDNLGTQMTANVVLDYVYDAAGRVLAVGETINGVPSAITGYTYDALDRPTTIKQSGGGTGTKRVDFGYNAIGQISTIDRFADLAAAQPVVATSHTYDPRLRLTGITHSRGGGHLVAFENVTYDAAGRITRIEDGDGTADYTYDDRNQIASADYSNVTHGDEQFTYDANGNRIDSSAHGAGYLTGSNNRLLSDGTFNYSYDEEGNMLMRTEIATGLVRHFTYDHRNRMTFVRDEDAAGNRIRTIAYLYDAFDRRIFRSVDASPTVPGETLVEHFVYDRTNVLLEFTDPDGTGFPQPPVFSRRYLHGNAVDQVLAEESSAGAARWHLADHLGSTRDLVDHAGTHRNRISYDAFGAVASQSNAQDSSRYLFTGREYDSELELYYYRARYYDPGIGRFLNEDPIAFRAGDPNLYRYVGNNPLGARDPLGLCETASPTFVDEIQMHPTYNYTGSGDPAPVWRSSPDQPWQPLAPGMDLQGGDQVDTRGANVTVKVGGTAIMHLEPDTVFTVPMTDQEARQKKQEILDSLPLLERINPFRDWAPDEHRLFYQPNTKDAVGGSKERSGREG